MEDNTGLLQEYTQWVAIQKSVSRDTSPEEFMRDRVKSEALDRIMSALDYMDGCALMRTEPSKHTIRKILEGTYEEPDSDGVGGADLPEKS